VPLGDPLAAGDVEPQVAGPTMIEAIAHLRQPAYLPRSHPRRAQFRAHIPRVGQARPLVNAHDVIHAALLQPLEEGGAREATVGQHDWADAGRQRGEHRRQRPLLQLVLAGIGGQVIAVVGELEERKCAPMQRHGDTHGYPLGGMIADALARGEDDIPHRPVDSEAEPAHPPEGGEGVRDQRRLDGEGIEAGGVEEAPEPLEAMEQIVLGMGDAAGRRRREGAGGEAAGTAGEQGADDEREVGGLSRSKGRQGGACQLK
jgi:hypothetical protein